MSVTWTPVPIPRPEIPLLTEAADEITTEDGTTIILDGIVLWSAETIPPLSWATVPIP